MTKKSINWLNLVFENRNKSYGAYELRVHYESRLLKAFGISLASVAVLFIIPLVLTRMLKHAEAVKDLVNKDVIYAYQKIEFEKTDISPVVEKRVVTKQVAVQHPVAADAYLIVKKTEPDNKPDVKPIDQPSSAISKGDETTTGTESNTSTTSSSSNNFPEVNEPMSAAAVDVAPSFPGGDEALHKYLSKNIHYSETAKDMHITGRIFACFIVNEKGEIENVKLKNSLFSDLDNEVIRVISKMPLWTPGVYKGKKVKTIYIVPVNFQLL